MLIISIAFFGVESSAFSQNEKLYKKNPGEKLESWVKVNMLEKAYLQFDKPYYAVGDTIYFKAYVTAGEVHKPETISRVLHVDLINTENKIDQSIKLRLDSGVAWAILLCPTPYKQAAIGFVPTRSGCAIAATVRFSKSNCGWYRQLQRKYRKA